ncbi:Uncharacterised protein [Shigella sonnei]|nr:Uncharacterised protein [Shigella sonnei]
MIKQQQVTVEIAHQPQTAGIFIEFFENNFRRFKLAQQDLCAGNVAPLTLQEVVVRKLRFSRMTQPVGSGGFIAGHLPVNHPDFVGVRDPVAVIFAIPQQVFQTVQLATGVI